jgi:hypothetical protein
MAVFNLLSPRTGYSNTPILEIAPFIRSTIMTTQHISQTEGSWAIFIEILSDEFTAKTGFGVYAHITPVDIVHAYHQYQHRNTPIRLFARDYVRPYTV